MSDNKTNLFYECDIVTSDNNYLVQVSDDTYIIFNADKAVGMLRLLDTDTMRDFGYWFVHTVVRDRNVFMKDALNMLRETELDIPNTILGLIHNNSKYKYLVQAFRNIDDLINKYR